MRSRHLLVETKKLPLLDFLYTRASDEKGGHEYRYVRRTQGPDIDFLIWSRLRDIGDLSAQLLREVLGPDSSSILTCMY